MKDVGFVRFIDRLVAVACLFLSGIVTVRGGSDGASADDWHELSDGVYSLYDSMIGLLQVIMLLAAAFAIVRVCIKLFQGEKEGVQRLVWWIVGFVFGFLMLSIINLVIR